MTDYTNIYTPSTLANMIADLSHYLAEQYDDVNGIDFRAWDATHAHMMALRDALDALVGDETDIRLMAAGANPEVIYD